MHLLTQPFARRSVHRKLDIRLAALGSLHVTRPILKHYTRNRAELIERATAVFDGIASGRLTLTIGETLPLAQAVEAHQKLEGRATSGKLLLIP